MFEQALEFRDGFLIAWNTDSLWIPKHALSDVLTSDDVADLLLREG